MLRPVLTFLALGACLVPAACGSGDVDPTGDYQITIVNRENGCHFEGWTEGTTTPYVVLGIRKSLESAEKRLGPKDKMVVLARARN